MQAPVESIHLYTLADVTGEGTGMTFGLRSYNGNPFAYNNNYYNAFKQVALSRGIDLKRQPVGLAWPPAQAPPVDPASLLAGVFYI